MFRRPTTQVDLTPAADGGGGPRSRRGWAADGGACEDGRWTMAHGSGRGWVGEGSATRTGEASAAVGNIKVIILSSDSSTLYRSKTMNYGSSLISLSLSLSQALRRLAVAVEVETPGRLVVAAEVDRAAGDGGGG